MKNNIVGSESRIFWTFIALHLSIWTLVPALTNHNLPIDIIEGLAWGNEGLWGYHKHPPLSPWLMDIFAKLSGSADWAQYLLSQISICVAFMGMWLLAREFLSPLKALISVLLLEGVYYHGYASPEFNANIVLLPFWSIAIFAFYKAVETQKLVWWLLLGGAAALAILGKYFTGFLLVSMLGYLVVTKTGRQQFKTMGPYAALVTLLVLLVPHFAWMSESNFVTLNYGINRAAGSASTDIKNHIVYPLKFLISQLILLLPLLLMLLTFGFKKDQAEKPGGNISVLSFLAFGPPLLIMGLSAAMGWKLRSMWGAPLFLVSGIMMMYFLRPTITAARMRRFKAVFLFFALIGPMAYVAVYAVRPLVKEGGKRTQFPGTEIARLLTEEWQARYPGKRLDYIMGDVWRAGNISYYGESLNFPQLSANTQRTASVFIDGDAAVSPWIISEDFKKKGGIVVWKGSKKAHRDTSKFQYYQREYPDLIVMEPLQFSWDSWFSQKSLTLGWAVLPPQ